MTPQDYLTTEECVKPSTFLHIMNGHTTLILTIIIVKERDKKFLTKRQLSLKEKRENEDLCSVDVN